MEPLGSADHFTLVELLDRVVDKGVFLRGDLVIAVADVDLLYIGLQAVVSSVSRLKATALPAQAKWALEFREGQGQLEPDTGRQYLRVVQARVEARAQCEQLARDFLNRLGPEVTASQVMARPNVLYRIEFRMRQSPGHTLQGAFSTLLQTLPQGIGVQLLPGGN